MTAVTILSRSFGAKLEIDFLGGMCYIPIIGRPILRSLEQNGRRHNGVQCECAD